MPGSVTRLLLAWKAGDETALARLTPLVYAELQQIARHCMRGEPARRSVEATELVNEAYMRLVDARHMNWQNRAHFLAMAARLMRRILVDLARTQRAQKRGGGALQISLDDALVTSEKGQDLVALDDALDALGKLDDRKSRVIELRFFGGLTVDETAMVLKISPDTVMRDWKLGRTWLRRALRHSGTDDS
jgi:RNA polymerase sigma factor (TIGR02999 family)